MLPFEGDAGAAPEQFTFFNPGDARAKPTRAGALTTVRRQRIRRIRRAVAILGVAAFIAPFGVIYGKAVDASAGSSTSRSQSSAPASVTTQQL